MGLGSWATSEVGVPGGAEWERRGDQPSKGSGCWSESLGFIRISDDKKTLFYRNSSFMGRGIEADCSFKSPDNWTVVATLTAQECAAS